MLAWRVKSDAPPDRRHLKLSRRPGPWLRFSADAKAAPCGRYGL